MPRQARASEAMVRDNMKKEEKWLQSSSDAI